MTQAEQYLVQAVAFLLCTCFIIIYMLILRRKYQKQAIDHVEAEIITPEGTGYYEVLLCERGIITLPPNEKKGRKGKTYPIKDVATYQVDYPSGWIPNFLKTKIKRIIIREDTWEPVTNFGEEPLLDPSMLFNIINERFTEIGVEHSREEARLQSQIKEMQKFKPTTMYIMMAMLALAVGALGFFLYSGISSLQETLFQITEALGI